MAPRDPGADVSSNPSRVDLSRSLAKAPILGTLQAGPGPSHYGLSLAPLSSSGWRRFLGAGRGGPGAWNLLATPPQHQGQSSGCRCAEGGGGEFHIFFLEGPDIGHQRFCLFSAKFLWASLEGLGLPKRNWWFREAPRFPPDRTFSTWQSWARGQVWGHPNLLLVLESVYLEKNWALSKLAAFLDGNGKNNQPACHPLLCFENLLLCAEVSVQIRPAQRCLPLPGGGWIGLEGLSHPKNCRRGCSSYPA